MFTFSLLPFSLISLLCVDAQKIPFTSISKSSPQERHNQLVLLASSDCANTTCGELVDVANDVLYVSDVTVGGVDYRVQLDTGSSDLWVNGSQIPIPNVQLVNGLVISDVYGDGSNFTGEIGFADVEFHGYKVSNQSFNYATVSENDNVSIFNLTGLIGLSFNGLSLVQQTVQQATGSATGGQTFLSNVFAANPSLEPFITFLLSREDDLNSTATKGAFTISQIEQGYDAISNQKEVPLVPPTSNQWTVAVDQLLVGGQAFSVPQSVVSGAGSSSVGLLDTGTSSILLSTTIVNEYYSQVTGAQQNGRSSWILPCDAVPPTLAFVIGGQTITVHPLDINPISTVYSNAGSLVSVCTGGIIGTKVSADEGFDFLLGAPFIKNSYTMFNYGSNATSTSTSTSTGGPFVKLLAITDPSNAPSDFTSTRKAQLALAPAASADQLSSILKGDPSFVPVSTPLLPNSPSSSGNGSSGGGSSSGGGGSGSGSGSGGGSTSNADSLKLSSALMTVLLAAFVGSL